MKKDQAEIFYTNVSSAKEAILSRGHFFGEVFFTSFKSWEGKIPFEGDHFQRIEDHCLFLQGRKAWEVEAVVERLDLLLQGQILLQQILNKNPNSYIRFMQWGNFPPGSYGLLPRSSHLSWAIWARALTPEQRFLQSLSMVELQLNPIVFPSFRLKLANYTPSIALMSDWEIKFQDTLDILYFHPQNQLVLESSTGNVFAFIKDRWVTPQYDVQNSPLLEGVMRKNLLKFMRNKRIGVEVRDLTVKELLQAEEIFLCNGVRGIIGVRSLHFANKKFHKPLGRTKEFFQVLRGVVR